VKDWIEKPLGDLVHDLTKIRLINLTPDDIVIDPTINSRTHRITIAAEQLGALVKIKKRVKLMPGDLVFSRLHTQNGAFAYCDKEFLATTTFIPFEVDESKVNRDFLYWALHVRVPSLSTSDSVGRETYKTQDILKLSIPLPSLLEQRRIFEHITRLNSSLENAQSLRRKTIEGVDLLFYEITKDAFSHYLNKVTKIGNVFRVTTGGTPSRNNPMYWGGSNKWVSSGEVAFRRIKDTNEKITDLGVAESNAKVYPPNTVLIAMIGQGKTRGQCAVLDCFASTNQNVAGIHVYETEQMPDYVYWWLRSRYYESRISEIGTAQPALSGERVKQMPIPLPNQNEQRQLIKYLDRMDTQISALREKQAESQKGLDALLPSILDKVFKGE
jgi:type I restriction enzyme, S subunit